MVVCVDNVVCPHCLSKHSKSMVIGNSGLINISETERYIVCNRCGKDFKLIADVTIKFRTTKNNSWCNLKEIKVGVDFSSTQDKTEYLNPYGKYVCKFAKNQGITINEAYEHPTVKARYEFFCKTGA